MKMLLYSFVLLVALRLNTPAYGGIKEIKECVAPYIPSKKTCLYIGGALLAVMIAYNIGLEDGGQAMYEYLKKNPCKLGNLSEKEFREIIKGYK